LAKKHKKHKPAADSPVVLRPRIERARAEGRYQQALELTKQLHKHQPTPEHRELLKEVYLGRARQLRTQGQTRDALTVLEAALRVDETSPAWLEQVAGEMARAGAAAQALALVERVPEAASAARIRGFVVDAAVQEPSTGRPALPPLLQTELDVILQASRQLETGDDEGARTTLQAIGLRSPFLDWKLLLRGLQAYYQNEDTRAVENWQRLDPERLPARLAAPFRFQIDTSFRASQPASTQAAIQRQFDAVQGGTLPAQLRALRAALENRRSLAGAFRQAEVLLPQLRQQAPALVPRLAACLYWAILDSGPDDVTRYRRVFGNPPDDPEFHRLQALAYEKAGDLPEAHRCWQQYEKDIAAHPEAWPDGQAARARALVWLRMGRNAVEVLEERDAPVSDFFPFGPFGLFGRPERPRALNPGPEQCLGHSIDLAPDLLEPYQKLLGYHLDEDHEAKAEKTARQLLERFPEHAPTLEKLADLRRRRGDAAEALLLLQRALHANPLDREMRRKVAQAHLEAARSLIAAKQYDEARQQTQAAETLFGTPLSDVLCVRAACDFKAGEVDRAEKVLQELRGRGEEPLGVAYAMLVEAARCKLPPAIKKRFEQEFKTGLEQPPSPAAAVMLLRLVWDLEVADVTYHGQKTHAKKAIDYAIRAGENAPTESQLGELSSLLGELKAFRNAGRLAERGAARFPHNPLFPFFQACNFMRQEGVDVRVWRVRPLLEQAERLARSEANAGRYPGLLDDIHERQRALDALNPFEAMMRQEFFGPEDEDEDEDEDDDLEEDFEED
jgi:tetratricopeptide (TPR) repeat protein